MSADKRLGASFRDPSGFIFTRQGVLYRQVNQRYQSDYERLMSSGLYAKLVQAGLLVPHAEVTEPPAEPDLAYKVIQPEKVEFISYPYEWCFSQLKAAALATLEIQKRALSLGQSLKDASAYNIQFHQGKPLLVDTLSFTEYKEGEPWVAYRQFCQHFLAPLALMAATDVRLSQLLRTYIDGIPLDLASRLLPKRTRLDFNLATHIHWHAAAQQRYAGRAPERGKTAVRVSRIALQGLIDSLQSAVNKLHWRPVGTEWGKYYTQDSGHYSEEALGHKGALVNRFIARAQPGSVWDLGANTGLFSRLASRSGIHTVAFDIDPAAVEINYLELVKKKETHLLPLVMDLTNPSPGLGWAHHERQAMLERGPADLVLALALVHHLAISNNVPLPQLSDFFAAAGRWLVIEFVPKQDSQVQKLLAWREDIFDAYTLEQFEAIFAERFIIHDQAPIQDTPRTLFLMERRE